MIAPFEASKLKLARAERHIDELSAEISTYLAEKPVAVIVEQPPELKDIESCAWITRIRRNVPVALSAIIGDAIHNLRAALDLLACDVVRLNGKDAKTVYFPFGKSAEQLEGQIKARNFQCAHPDCVNLLRSLQPYTGGNVALRGIHDLDVRDKHVALIPAIGAAYIDAFTLKIGDHLNPIPSWSSTIPRDGWWMLRLPMANNIALGTEIRAEFTLVFDNDSPFAGHEIIKTLRAIHEHVTGTIKAFETLCEGQAFPPVAKGRAPGSNALIIGDPVKPRQTGPVIVRR
jgi:hypothetical protein